MATIIDTILSLRKSADEALAQAQIAENIARAALEQAAVSRILAQKHQAEICDIIAKAGIKVG